MATEIRVPTLGESVSEATIGQWFKKPGDAVAVDEPLVELETDKVTIEVPAPAAGVLAEILAKDGETVAVGALLGTLDSAGAAAAAPKAAEPKAAAPAAPAPVALAALEPRSAPLVVEPAGRGEAHPPAEFVPATDRNAPKTTAARTGRAPSRTVETMVAEAMLPPNTVGKGERVVIRFVSQRSGGCGSLEGRDRVCVALAGGTGAGM